MATIRDVAKLANVSVATVSRVINKNGYVNEST
ncbi:MAG: LacI family DNA-binding transcriptional regulator, partial [Oceanobacillus sp.]|nr:LacI family DNA-binding transcriptional regulator [Oceanobacillus sp.]